MNLNLDCWYIITNNLKHKLLFLFTSKHLNTLYNEKKESYLSLWNSSQSYIKFLEQLVVEYVGKENEYGIEIRSDYWLETRSKVWYKPHVKGILSSDSESDCDCDSCIYGDEDVIGSGVIGWAYSIDYEQDNLIRGEETWIEDNKWYEEIILGDQIISHG